MAINFNKSTTRKRVLWAIGWVAANTSHTTPQLSHALHHADIDNHVGRPNTELGAYLRNALLTVDNPYWNKTLGYCKEYLRNDAGAQALCDMYGVIYDSKLIGTAFADNKFGKDINHIYYKIAPKSKRPVHSTQNISNGVREQLFGIYNYIHNYDVNSCALNLLFQHSRKCYIRASYNPYTKASEHAILATYRNMDALIYAIENKKELRNQLSEDLDIRVEDIKRILTMMLNGANIDGFSSVYAVLRRDKVKLKELRSHPFIKEYKADIKSLWTAIKIHDNVNLKKDKWAVYYHLEKTVMDSVYSYLASQGIKNPVKEHDGFRTRKEIDLHDLEAYVKKKTKFRITFKHEKVIVYKTKADVKLTSKDLFTATKSAKTSNKRKEISAITKIKNARTAKEKIHKLRK